jgi:hypothetical protein
MRTPISGIVATIANGAALSGAIDLDGYTLCGIQMPSAWTTANLTFQVSADGATYADVYSDSGGEYTVTAAASRYIVLNPADFAGMRFLKVRSGTTGTPVNQGGARTMLLNVRPT